MKSPIHTVALVLFVLILQSTAMATPLMQATMATTAQATMPLLQVSSLQVSHLLESISEAVFLGMSF